MGVYLQSLETGRKLRFTEWAFMVPATMESKFFLIKGGDYIFEWVETELGTITNDAVIHFNNGTAIRIVNSHPDYFTFNYGSGNADTLFIQTKASRVGATVETDTQKRTFAINNTQYSVGEEYYGGLVVPYSASGVVGTYNDGTIYKDGYYYPRLSFYNSISMGEYIGENWLTDSFPGNTGGTGGGTGTFDGTGDSIDFQGIPTLSAVNAGFVTLYNPTITQMNDLASYMWTTDFIDNIKKLFGDPMDAILGLSIIPVSPPISGAQEVKVGFIATGVTMNLISSQYVQVDCGTLTIEEYWGSALDYSPYTKIQIYLPYIGIREINTDDVMKKSVHVIYNIDILSGSLSAQIKCGTSVLYQFSGSCASVIPVTGRDFAQVISAAISAAGTVGSLVATGGASAGITAAMAVSGVMTTANNVMTAKPRVQHSGAMGNTAGLMGVQTPYLIIERPRQALAKDYKKFNGYPSNITALISTLTGYTEIESVQLKNINATSIELDEIEKVLKEGFII